MKKVRKFVIDLLVSKYRNNPTKLKEETKEFNKVHLKKGIVSIDGNFSRRCDNCNIVVHRARYSILLKNKKHQKQLESFIPEWLFRDLTENKPEQMYNLESLKQMAREIIRNH